MRPFSGCIAAFNTAVNTFENVKKVARKAKEVVKNVYDGFSYFANLKRQQQSAPKEGKQLEAELQETQQQLQRVVTTSHREVQVRRQQVTQVFQHHAIITDFFEVNVRATEELIKAPESFGVTDIDYLRDVKSLGRYESSGIYRTIILPDRNTDHHIIGHIPTPVIVANFVHPWELPLDLGRLAQFGITSYDIMPEVSKWFDMLSREDQVYFSQLYKDYYQLAQFLGQKDIPTPTDFVQELYTKRNQILRETGAKAVMFTLRTETVGGKRAKIKAQVLR